MSNLQMKIRSIQSISEDMITKALLSMTSIRDWV